MHAQADGQVENIKHLAAHMMDSAWKQTKIERFVINFALKN